MSGTKVKLFLTINLLFNFECLDVGSPVQMPVFKKSAKGRGIRDPPRSRRNKKKNVCFILPSLSAKVRRAKYCHVKCRLVASIVHPSSSRTNSPAIMQCDVRYLVFRLSFHILSKYVE